MGNEVERVSRSMVRKDNFYLNLMKIERVRGEVRHLATYATEKTEVDVWNPRPR
jgi:hypothetical protein